MISDDRDRLKARANRNDSSISYKFAIWEVIVFRGRTSRPEGIKAKATPVLRLRWQMNPEGRTFVWHALYVNVATVSLNNSIANRQA